MRDPSGRAWHAMPVSQVFEELNTSPDGLSRDEAQGRLERYGPNEIRREERPSPILLFLEQFRNPLVYILLVAAVLSFLSAHPVDGGVILAIVILNAVIGFFQESRAEQAIEALRRLSALQASAIRGGGEEEIPSAELVPGDVILLESGDKVPADSRLIEAANLEADEAALTGESLPVSKGVDPMSEDTPLAERGNMVYSGTTITYGRGTAVVAETGMATQIGRIAEAVAAEPRGQTPVQQKLTRLAGYLGIVGVFVAIAVVVAGIYRRLDLFEVFFLGVAAAVSFIPEGLPAVVTVVLAVGVQRMAKRYAVIRKLPAVETLGSATVICTDKTGTLTRNELTAKKAYVAGTEFDVTGQGYEPEGTFTVGDREAGPDEYPGMRCLMTAMVLCNDSRLSYSEEENSWRVMGDPTEGALIVAGEKAGLRKHDLEEEQPRIDEIPFDSQKRYMATLHGTSDGRKIVYVKGAPERISAMSARYLRDGAEQELTDEARADFGSHAHLMAEGALRVLFAAYKELPADTERLSNEDVESGLTLIGAVGMIDPPREEAREAIRKAKGAGIRVIMVTGDHADTARAIAESLGLMEEGMRVVQGRALDSMSDEQLAEEIRNIAVFARAEPEHKIRIVRALKSQGQIVAMTGDGVNDAPALKLADIGISMGITGTDVAKEASDMVLANDNFATIVDAIEEGRGIFANIRRVVLYLLSTNTGEILIYLVTILVGLPIPLVPVQILWINLVTDGSATVPLSLEPREVGVLNRPPRDPSEPIVNARVAKRIVYFALFMFFGTLSVYYWGLQNVSLERARTYAFVLMALFQLFNALNVRSDRFSVFQVGFFSNPYLLVGLGAALLAQIAAVQLPFMQPIFRTASLSLQEWAVLAFISSTIFWADEIRKAIYRSRVGGDSDPR